MIGYLEKKYGAMVIVALLGAYALGFFPDIFDFDILGFQIKKILGVLSAIVLYIIKADRI